MPKSIRAILCDADGTLIDSFSHGLRKMWVVAERLGFHFDEDTERTALLHWGAALRDHFNICFPSMTDEQFEEAMKIFDELDYVETPPAIEGAAVTLAFLREQGVMFTIVTSRDSITLDHILKHNEIDHHFDHVAAEDTVEFLKPDPRVFACTRALLRERGIQDDECLFIGDTLTDFNAGMAAGFRTVIVKTGPLTGSDARIPETDHIHSFAELPAWMEQHGVHP